MLAAVQAVSVLEATQSMLEAAGFQSLVFEDFLETFTILIKRVCDVQNGEPLLTHQRLLEAFNDPEGML
jgi:ubiquitin thioesterase protein OTUB1